MAGLEFCKMGLIVIGLALIIIAALGLASKFINWRRERYAAKHGRWPD